MAKNTNVFKFDIIERTIAELDFTTKEEVLRLSEIMKDVASKKDYSDNVKKAFVDAYNELNSDDFTLENLKEIKKLIKMD
ncbi:MAG: hypothetical protein E7361_00110 [Clostridiales bacterium]|nr:hypothetical protein [Clostridiales bacterium]